MRAENRFPFFFIQRLGRAWTQHLFAGQPQLLAFSRRRSTEEGILRLSRYLATVRLAMSILTAFSLVTIASSESICPGLSRSISCLIRNHTDSAEWASPPSRAEIEAVKKYLSSKRPRGVAIYLLEVTRDTVDSCTPTASAIVLRSSGRKYSTPCAKKLSCWRTISLDTFRIVRALCSRLFVSQFADCLQAEMKLRSASFPLSFPFPFPLPTRVTY